MLIELFVFPVLFILIGFFKLVEPRILAKLFLVLIAKRLAIIMVICTLVIIRKLVINVRIIDVPRLGYERILDNLFRLKCRQFITGRHFLFRQFIGPENV